MKIKCQECNTYIEVDENEYEKDVEYCIECPLCSSDVHFTITKEKPKVESSTIKSITPTPIPVPSPPPIKVLENSQYEEVNYQPIKPATHMAMAVLCTLFCCMPLGVVAIYYASKVDKAYYQGEYFDAEQYSERAKTWTYLGIGIVIVSFVIYYMFIIFKS